MLAWTRVWVLLARGLLDTHLLQGQAGLLFREDGAGPGMGPGCSFLHDSVGNSLAMTPA